MTPTMQNKVRLSVFDQIVRDSAHYAAESGEPLAEYLLRDYDAAPENWDSAFYYPLHEIGAEAQKERRKIIENELKDY